MSQCELGARAERRHAEGAVGAAGGAPVLERAADAIEFAEATLKIWLMRKGEVAAPEPRAPEPGQELEYLGHRLARDDAVQAHHLGRALKGTRP